MMRLHEVMAGLPSATLPAANPEITGVGHDSRRIAAGDLYVAIVGARHNGRDFVAQAVERGAVAALGPGEAPAGLRVPWIRVDNPRPLLGPIAARVYGQPHQRLLMIGITGTNGKSTVMSLVARMLEAAGQPAGIIGTIEYRFRDRTFADDLGIARRTTPEACDLFRLLAEMHAAGARAVVMEVSSHALVQERVAGAAFDVAVFTNLSRDHFDFHDGLEDYFAAKRRLFEQLKPGGRTVVNLDDPWGQRLAQEVPDPLGYGRQAVVGEERGNDPTVRPLRFELALGGTSGTVATSRGEYSFSSSLIGHYNLENLMAAVAVAEALELPAAAIREGIAAQPPLPGRMEPVAAGQDFPALIDYSHTPAGLQEALTTLRQIGNCQVALVFGCGGERDPGKREVMGRVAGELAGLAIATSDNPRGERPMDIIKPILRGLRKSPLRSYFAVLDRRLAIRCAVRFVAEAPAGEAWAVLVAGKGHERWQITGQQIVPFSDREELEKAIAAAREAGGD